MKNHWKIVGGLCLVLMWTSLLAPAVGAEKLTIVGVVNEDRQMMDDNDRIYVIGDNQKGRELRLQVEKRLRVVGFLEKADGEEHLMVISYEVINE